MLLKTFVKPGSKLEKHYINDQEILVVHLKARPIEGKANEALRQYVAKQLHIAPSNVELIAGHTSKIKTLRIPDDLDTSALLIKKF